MKHLYLFLMLTVLLLPSANARPSAHARRAVQQAATTRLPATEPGRVSAGPDAQVAFLENRGQVFDTQGKQRPDVAFVANAGNVRVFFSSARISYVFTTVTDVTGDATDAEPSLLGDKMHTGTMSTLRMDLELIGAHPDARVRGDNATDGVVNLYMPGAPNGILGLRSYRTLVFENVYDNIDLVYHTSDGALKYDFVVRPGGRVSDIRLRYSGATGVSANASGGLHVETALGSLLEGAPVSWQYQAEPDNGPRVNVRSGFRLEGSEVTFDVGAYDPAKTLIIDPTLQWSTYYGGSNFEQAQGITADAAGNAIIAGYTFSANFPVTAGAIQTSNAGSQDAFVAKFDVSGVRQWATYYGGNNNDPASSIAADGGGNIYVGGRTESTNFPVTAGAYQTVRAGAGEGWLLKLNSAGVRQWCTFIGGSNDETVNGVASDDVGNVVVCGTTSSTNLAMTTGAVQGSFGGYSDAFVMKFDPNGGRLWGTYYGGINEETGNAVCYDLAGNVVFTGMTRSGNFPCTANAAQPGFAGSNDVYVVKLSTSGALSYASYFGGSSYDVGRSVAVDPYNNIIIAGVTNSMDLPGTMAGFRPFLGGGEDAFVVRFRSTGALTWSTYYGGALNDAAFAVSTDLLGRISVVGQTFSPNFPVSGGALQPLRNGLTDAFAVKFDSSGNRIWGTYFGGSGDEAAYALASQYSGNLLMAGWSSSPNFPVTAGAYQTTHSGSYDAFVTKICDVKPIIMASRGTNLCPGDSVWLDAGAGYVSWLWSTGATTQRIKVGATGKYTVRVVDGIGCFGISDTMFVNVAAPLVANAGPDVEVCAGSSIVIGAPATGGALPLKYAWSPKAGLSDSTIAQPSASPASSTTYTLRITDAYGCTSIDDVVVGVNPNPVVDAGRNDTICYGSSIVIGNPATSGTGAITYSWAPTAGLNNPGIAQPTASPLTSTTYRVTAMDSKGCIATDTVRITVDRILATAGADHSICQNDTTTLRSLSIGGIGALTYAWTPTTGLSTPNSATTKASPPSATNYILTVTDSRGCFVRDTVRVGVYNALKALAGPDLQMCSGSYVVIGDTAVCGSGPLRYSWSPTTGLSDPYIARPIAIPTSTTQYVLTVTDTLNNVARDTMWVVVNSHPVADAGPDPVKICPGTFMRLRGSASGTVGPYQALWAPATGLDDPTLLQPKASPSVSTRYILHVTDANGCTADDTVMVIVSDFAFNVDPVVPLCYQDSVVIGRPATGGTGPKTYSWSPSTNLSSATVVQPTAWPTATTQYVVTATDSVGCVLSDTVTVVVNNRPVANAGNDTVICRYERAIIGAPATGGTPPYTYSWSPSNDLSSTTTMRPIASPHVTRTYRVKVTDANQCTSYDSMTVFVRQWPIANAGRDTIICRGDSVRLGRIATNGVPPYNYAWTPSYGLQDTTIATPKCSPFFPTTYILTVTDALGCQDFDTVRVTSITPPLPFITALGPTTFCEGDSVTLDADTLGQYFGYLWSTGATTRQIRVGASGSYQVWVNLNTGCPGVSPLLNVKVRRQPHPYSTVVPNLRFCEGGSTTIILDSTNLRSIVWMDGTQGPKKVVTASGTYYATVTDIYGCVGTSASYIINVLPKPTPLINVSAPLTFCEGDSVVLSTSEYYDSYRWTNGSTEQYIVVRQSGKYAVTVTGMFGCVATSDTLTVTVNPKPHPTISASGPLTFCEGGFVNLDAGSGYASYLWSNGKTTQSITVDLGGTYSCLVSYPAGCATVTPPVVVSVKPAPRPVVTALGPDVVCQGDTVVLDAGSGYRTYLWSTNETTRTIVVRQSGVFSVSVIDANGCSATSAGKMVTVNQPPAPVISASGPLQFCAGDSVVFDAGDYASYNWSNGARTRRIIVRETGTFTVRVMSQNGCEAVSPPITTKRNEPPTPVITAGGPLVFCLGGSVILDAGPGYKVYEWSTGAKTRRLTVTQSGLYNVRVTDSAGCRGESQFVTVTVNALPSRPVVTLVDPYHITSTVATTYQWNLAGVPITGATNRVYAPTKSGSYSVTITDANGCTATSIAFAYTYPTTPVEDMTVVTSFSLYPDPNVGHVMVDASFAMPVHTRLSVMNLLGQQVIFHDEGIVQTLHRQLDMQRLPSGLYFLHLNAGTRSFIRKIVRQ